MNYALNEEKMFADVTDGIAIIINSETGIYYGLNNFGTAVYENMANGASVEEILNALKSLDGVPADMEDRLNNFIKSMLSFELIVESADSSASVSIDASVASDDDFELKCEEYNDAQELLLADPIHEVKEDEGWTPEKSSIGYSKEETAKREENVEEE